MYPLQFESFSSFLEICFGVNILLTVYGRLTAILADAFDRAGAHGKREMNNLAARLDAKDQAVYIRQAEDAMQRIQRINETYKELQKKIADVARIVSVFFALACVALIYANECWNFLYFNGHKWLWVLAIPVPGYYLTGLGVYLWFKFKKLNPQWKQLTEVYKRSSERYRLSEVLK